MKECKRIIRVLSDIETELIRDLFNRVGNKKLSDKLAIVAEFCSFDCPHHYSWAYEYYCNDPDNIKEFEEKSED